jgi:hypothetical protein
MMDSDPAAMFHPDIVPSSVANRNVAGLPSINVNALLDANELNTCPVGAAGPPSGVAGAMVTGGMTFSVTLPATRLSILLRPLPLSEIQNGLVGL